MAGAERWCHPVAAAAAWERVARCMHHVVPAPVNSLGSATTSEPDGAPGCAQELRAVRVSAEAELAASVQAWELARVCGVLPVR